MAALTQGAQRVKRTLELQMLRLIVAKLSEIETRLNSPLTARQLHRRYCCGCGVAVTNRNIGGYEGRSALTGRLFCDLCAEEAEKP